MQPKPLSEAVLALREGRWNEYEALIRRLRKIDGDQIWERIAAEHPASVDLISALRPLSGEQARNACQTLLPAIGKLAVFSLEDALVLLGFSEVLGLSYRHLPARQLQSHITQKIGFGNAIGERLRANTHLGESAQRVWAGAYTSAAPLAAAQYVAELMTDTSLDTQLLISLINFLPVDVTEVKTELASRESLLADLLFGKTTEAGYAAWSALTCLATFSPTAVGYLLSGLESEDASAAMAVANSLYRLSAPSFGVTAEPLEDIVKSLLSIAVHDEKARAQIDESIQNLVSQDALRPHAVACLLDLCTLDVNVVEMLGKTFGELGQHPVDYFLVLSDWLLRPDARLSSIGDLLSLCTMHRAQVGLNAGVFLEQGRERRIKAARRLLALIHHGPTLCQFIAVIAEMDALGEERLLLAGEMLSLTFAEYPGATEEFLKEKTKSCLRTDPSARVFRLEYANVLRWRRVLAQLPKRKELRPAESELHALRAMRRRVNREIMRKAEERSVFRDLFASSHIAQGRKFASHTEFGPPQVAEMAESSHSIELPSSEGADPMRGLLERRKLWMNAQ